MNNKGVCRDLTAEFFNHPMGSLIRDSIYSDCTLFYKDTDHIFIGRIETIDMELVYLQEETKFKYNNSGIKFIDYLKIDGVKLKDEDIISRKDRYNYDVTEITLENNPMFRYRFSCTWTTHIYVDGKLFSVYEKEIKFINERSLERKMTIS